MHPNTDDKDLRHLFAAMRQGEARRAPAFDPFWDRTVARADRPRGVWMRYAAAAVLLVGVALSALLFLQPRDAMSITEWQSPTAGLLQTPAMRLDAEPLPTSALLAPPAPRLETYVPETQIFLPGEATLPDTTN